MSLKNKLSLFLSNAVFVSSMLAPVAHAWDGTVTGRIVTVDVAEGSNYGFRITMSGVSNMCTDGPSWAYLNDTDSNYKTYVSALMLAKVQGVNVTVYSNRVGANCHIGYISVKNS